MKTFIRSLAMLAVASSLTLSAVAGEKCCKNGEKSCSKEAKAKCSKEAAAKGKECSKKEAAKEAKTTEKK